MKKTGIMKMLSVCTFLLVPVISNAQPDGQVTERKQHMWSDLGLTEDQNVKLKQLHQEIKGIRSKNFEAVRAVRLKIREELAKPNPSSEQLDLYASELGNLHKEMVQQHNNHLLKVKTILSTEQFSKLLSKERDGFGMHWKNKKANHGGQCSKSGVMNQKKCNINGQTHQGSAQIAE